MDLVKWWEILAEKQKELEEQLEDLYSEVSGNSASLKPDSSNYDFADGASTLSAREGKYQDIENIKQELLEIKHALNKLSRKPESFGICERCEGRISVERLNAIPWAKYCYNCKNKKVSGVSKSGKNH